MPYIKITVMKTCPYCEEEFSDKGLSLHIWKVHKRQVEVKKYFAEEDRRISAQVHAEVVAKKREFAVRDRTEQLHNEMQQLADDIENSWKPLQNCSLCGQSWDAHADGCPMKQTKSTFDEFLDFMTTLLGGSQ